MTPERWQQVKNTLAEALERNDETARTAFLETACIDDSDLRREVESLLAQPDDEFDSAAEVIGVANGHSSNTGRRIGAYELVRELGRGGMGSVWLAQRADQHFEKLVAIKLLKRGTDTDEVLRRFHAERLILARLDHPNIARLLDAGTTDDDLPYFVMEYVEGKRLIDYARDENLSLGERLRLFLKICGAVQFAHQNLVVHRDLKPGNILVTTECEPKLLDFGVAKLLAAENMALLTMAGEQRFTPAYASPEQVEGEQVTTLSDVYTCGTILYELLTATPAHRFSTAQPPPTELLRVVAQEEPTRPSAVAIDPATKRTLRGDLDNIILKALRKEPSRRYTGMGAFAEDIRRHLEDRPVRARKDTVSYRVGKFVRRNKIGVAAAALLLFTLIAGIIGTAWEARVANRRFKDVRRLAHSVLFDYHDAIANLPGSTAVRQKLVTDSLQYLDSLAKEGGREESLTHEIASAYVKVGDVQGRPYFASLGDTAGAQASYGKAVEGFDNLASVHPTNFQFQTERAGAYCRLSEVRRQRGDLPAALAAARNAVAIMESIPSQVTTPDIREGMAYACLALGDVLGNPFTNSLGDHKGALESYRRTLSIREELRGGDPGDSNRARNASVAHSRVGNMLQMVKDNRGALEQYGAQLAIDEALLASDPTNTLSQRSVSISLQSSVPLLVEMGDLPKAREFLEKSVALDEQRAKADPKNESAKTDLGIGYSRMIGLLGKSADLAGARQFFEKALAIFSEQLAKDPRDVNSLMTLRATYARMADVLIDLGKPAESLVQANKGVEIAGSVVSLGSRPQTRRFKAHSLIQRAKVYTLLATAEDAPAAREENWRRARVDYQESLDLLATIPDSGSLPMDQEKREEAQAGLAKCDAVLTR